mmetsp:Transcript_28588/g.25302  ORF Transcript_28588/g.25302 Transcript_28588/m.25302 type:complete len:105 (+) Transcript_28588:943-1257(+)
MTHEARSSLNKKEKFMPQARFNDKKMYLGNLEKCNKFSLLRFINRYTTAKHTEFPKFNGLEATEIKLSPQVDSYFNIDGEIFPNDEVQVKLLPSYLNLIGKVYD